MGGIGGGDEGEWMSPWKRNLEISSIEISQTLKAGGETQLIGNMDVSSCCVTDTGVFACIDRNMPSNDEM